MKIVGRYKNERPQGEREIDYFANAFGELLIAGKKEEGELLGEIYMQWEISNKFTGQFFTPWHVARLVAKITQPSKTVSDPACGAGAMLVASALEMTPEQRKEAVFVGQDMDFTCVMMCALNLTFFNLNGYVIWGNTLTLEYLRVFETKRSYLGGSIRELTAEEVKIIRPRIEKTKEEIKLTQNTLF